MNHLKLFEEFGLLDRIKGVYQKYKYKNHFSEEEYLKFLDALQKDQLVKVTRVSSSGKNLSNKQWIDSRSIIDSIEVFFGSQTRSSFSPQYILVKKQDSEYKVISHEEVYKSAQEYRVGEEFRVQRYETIEKTIDEIKRRFLVMYIAIYVVKKYTKVGEIDLRWNRINISEEEYKEAQDFLNDYSILNKKGQLSKERLQILMLDEIGEDTIKPRHYGLPVPNYHELIEHLKYYFSI
jgi:hypothetical protein